MRLFDEENQTGIRLSDSQAAKLKAAMDAGNIHDGCGDVLKWDEVIDGGGDIVLDELGYEEAKRAACA
jgi:hypothetical protein